MYNEWPLADALAFLSSSFRFCLSLFSPFYILSPTPLLLPCHPCTPVTFSVFSIIIPFFFISSAPPSSQLFLLSLLEEAPSQLKCPNNPLVYTRFSSTVMYPIKAVSTCVSLYIQYAICYLIRPHPAVCLAAIHFNWASVCVLTGDYILPLSSDKTVQCLHHMRWSTAYWMKQCLVLTWMFFSPSDKGKPITR